MSETLGFDSLASESTAKVNPKALLHLLDAADSHGEWRGNT